MNLKYLALAACSLLSSVLAIAQTDSPPQPKQEMRTWLGVATSDVPPVLRQHLDLEDGFGILVSHIPDDSPASSAGLKPGDVLTKLDDQILTTPEHLSILVRSKKEGDKIDLTYLRKGTEQKTSATLTEKEMPVMDRHQPIPPYGTPEHLKQWHDQMRQQQEHFQRRMQDTPRNPIQDRPRFDRQEEFKGRKGDNPDLNRGESKGNRGSSPKPIMQNESVVKIDNDHGKVEISQKNGKGSIKISDAEGKEIFSGSFDRSKGITGLPENAQNFLKEMKVDTVDLLAPTPAPIMPKPEPKHDHDHKHDHKPDNTGEPL